MKELKTTEQAHPAAPGKPDFKALYRKIEGILDRLEGMQGISEVFSEILKSLLKDFEEDFGFIAGRLYRRDDEGLILLCLAGGHAKTLDSYSIPLDYEPVRRLLEDGLIIMGEGDPGFDEKIEAPIGVSKFAAIAVGEANTHVMSFSIRGEIKEEQITYSLSAIRHVINMKLRQEHLSGSMNESRKIQESLLPPAAPKFDGYDVDGRSRPTEIVGGDLYDYVDLSANLIGVAIADASGHGLPAALLARDVITGLRVGMSEDLKIIKTIEKLNRVIHRSALSSKFVSLFYCELDRRGNLIYSNAGHTPPLLLKNGEFEELTLGGMVLGPFPEAQYERGYVRLAAGDVVVMYTDGIPECENFLGEQFGMERLKQTIRNLGGASAREMVDGIFAAADTFSEGAHQNDDMTVVVVRKV